MSATAPEAPPTRVARPKSLRESLLDMGRSLGLMLLILAVVMLLTPARGLIFPDRNDRMPATDWSDVVSGFGQITHRMAFTPAGLPSSWRSNAAYLTGSSAADERLHIGFVTPGSHYAEVDETAGDGAALIADVLGKRGAATAGTATIGGVAWDVRFSDRGEMARTWIIDGMTVVVTGDAPAADLDRLCASLHAVVHQD